MTTRFISKRKRKWRNISWNKFKGSKCPIGLLEPGFYTCQMKIKKIKKILRQKIQAFFYFIISKSYFAWKKIHAKWQGSTRKQKRIMAIIIILLISVAIVAWKAPIWYKQYVFRTRWLSDQKDLKPISGDNASRDSGQTCEQKRKTTENLYAVSDIPAVIKNSSNDKIVLVGKEAETPGATSDSATSDLPAIVIDAAGKDVTLFCFDFRQRVVVENAGTLEIGYSRFQDIFGNALTIANGNGKIHDNNIENSQGSGIFANAGNWEIFGNTIQKNSSYGVYGGYGASLDIHDNAISENKGYQIRLLQSREVYR